MARKIPAVVIPRSSFLTEHWDYKSDEVSIKDAFAATLEANGRLEFRVIAAQALISKLGLGGV